MSEKGLYKKTTGPGWDHPEGVQRPRENRFFDKAHKDEVSKKSKSKAKSTPRSNHKHVYNPVLIWRKNIFNWLNDDVSGSVAKRCEICGKIEEGRLSYLFHNKENKYYGELEHFWCDEQDNLLKIESTKFRKKIFLGGPKIVNNIGDDVKSDLLSFMNCGHDILIGDCMGADLQIQKFLFENGYLNVTVYYSGDRARVNLGNWKTKFISSNKYLSDYERQKLKDVQMAIDSDEGYMILKEETKGTIANIKKLIELNKTCRVCIEACSELKKYMGYRKLNVKNNEDFDRIRMYL